MSKNTLIVTCLHCLAAAFDVEKLVPFRRNYLQHSHSISLTKFCNLKFISVYLTRRYYRAHFLTQRTFADIILVFELSISMLREHAYHEKPNIIVVPVSANVLTSISMGESNTIVSARIG